MPGLGLARLGLRRREDGSTHIRPGGAIVLCLLVWAVCAATVLQAFWLLGADGWRFAVLPSVASALIWVVLWAPRVVVHADRLEVRNVLVTRVLPMALIERARLGVMLRLELMPSHEGAKPEVVTAWNAPGVGRDSPRERIASSDPRSRHGSGAAARPDWSARLVRDQRASASYPALEAWETWQRSHDAAAVTAAEAGELRRTARQRPNLVVLALLAACVAAVALRAVL